MMGVIVIAAVVFIVIPSLFVVLLLGGQKPKNIELADDFKVRPKRYTKEEMRKRSVGNSTILGTDHVTKQDYILPEKIRYSATVVVGGTGAGKNVFITASMLKDDISKKDNAVGVFDGQKTRLTDEAIALCKQFNREYIVLPEAGFNPLGGRGTSAERADAFANLYAQIGGTPTSDAGKYFLRQGQLFIRRGIQLFERAYMRPATLRELYLLATNEDVRQKTLDDAGDCEESISFLEGTKAWSTQNWSANTADLCGMIDGILIGNRKHYYCDTTAPALEDYIEQKKVIIMREGSYKNTSDHILGLMFMVRIQEYARMREERDDNFFISVYLDEAYQYFNDSYPSFLSQSRKKGIAQTLLFQSFKHFEPYSTLLATNCKTWIIMPGLLHEDATFVSDTIGKRIHKYRSQSRQDGTLKGSETATYSYSYLVEPHEIMDMAEGKAIVLSQNGRERDVYRFITLVPRLDLDTDRYVEPSVGSQGVPELIWDELRKLAPPSIHDALEGDVGAIGEDVRGERAPDWYVDSDEPESV